MLKRFSIVLVLVLALTMVFAASAFANFGPHGGYANDTDSCAGCHRAHTSFSTVGWTDKGGNAHASALLVGNATTMTEFCDACHGDTAPGASTNVASGIFDSGPSAARSVVAPAGSGSNGVIVAGAPVSNATHTNGVAGGSDGGVAVSATAYQTDSTFNAPLNGGGFNRMPDPYAWELSQVAPAHVAAPSAHKMDVSGPLWGAGTSVQQFGGTVGLTCTDCHDPHGSSNYRLLKAIPNPAGPTVGGYQADNETPNAFVFSNEQGYPVPNGKDAFGGTADPNNVVGGWLKHAAGAAQMALYRPNYTDTTGTPILHVDGAAAGSPASKSMSVWCAACHTNYNQASAGTAVPYNYNPYLPAAGLSSAPPVNGTNFHRHPIDQTLAAGAPGNTNASLTEPVRSDAKWIPLEQATSGDGSFTNNYIGCLTCHRAHGSSVVMSGWSNAHLEQVSISTTGTPRNVYVPVRDAVWGVDPDKGAYNGADLQGTSALLRADNRGVCERCHNK
jgi:hypothetical protein